jgi:uncharacterized protein (DUF58 family)
VTSLTQIEERVQRIQENIRQGRTAGGEIVYESGNFNESWIWLGVFFTVLGLATGQSGLLALAACLFTVIPVAWLWNRYVLAGLLYERRLSVRRAFPGEIVELTLSVTNPKPLPIPWVRVVDYLPAALPVREVALLAAGKDKTTLVTTWALRWFDRATRHYHLFCTRRGHYALGPTEFSSGDAFALFTSRREQGRSDRLVVFPEIWPLSALGLPAKDPFGVAATHERLFEDPVRTRGVRDLQPDDSFRTVHWKASARHGQLQARVFEPTSDLQLMIFLNVTSLPRHWQGQIPELFERAVSVAGSIARHGDEQGWRVGLIANGVAPQSDQALRVLPRRSPDQLGEILTALASVTSFPAAAIDAMLNAESPRLPWGATLVVVTAIVTDELAATLVRLREAGRRVALVALGPQPPPELPGVRCYHSPPPARSFRRRGAPADGDPTLASLAGVPAPRPHEPPEDWLLPRLLAGPEPAEPDDATG